MTKCRHGLSEDCPACMWDTIDGLVKALEPFAEYAYIKGGTDRSPELRTIITKILESAPYPADLEAISQFCNAVLGARKALRALHDGKQP